MEENNKNKKPVVAVLGTGLIGCSMADGLRGWAGEIIGADNNTAHLDEALGRGLIDRSMAAGEAVKAAGLVIIAMPVDATVRVLPGVLDNAGDAVVIDAGSVKGAVCRSVERHPNRDRFVAAHPMAGLAVSGPGASDAMIFRNRKVVICERERSSEKALETCMEVFGRLKMEPVFMDPLFHDQCVARVSHLPQVVAYCLSAITAEDSSLRDSMLKIASSGFESATRLSSSPAGMWLPIFRQNAENLNGSIDELIRYLSTVQQMIGAGEWDALGAFVEEANDARKRYMSAYKNR
ncbi:MAG: prephenate dehydrogenase/arogenate dehydrogenase family protein [Marinilabiliales bacterium]|nr:MAG: prephenate dehydrogenase/arogenate dehydrogenase family protein [Marinilabiliales bacterium]